MNRRDTLRLALWFFELDKNREKNIKRHRCRICLISYPNFILSRVNIHSVIIVHSQCTKYSGDDEYVAITIQWNNMPLTSMIVLEEETLFSLNIRCKLKDCTRQRNIHIFRVKWCVKGMILSIQRRNIDVIMFEEKLCPRKKKLHCI